MITCTPIGAVKCAVNEMSQGGWAKVDSEIRARLETMVRGIGEAIQNDPELRSTLNAELRTGILAFAEANRDQVAVFIRDTVAKWDAEDLCRNLEAEVGRDLQFIRINGTIVGGLVGLALHWMSQSLWP